MKFFNLIFALLLFLQVSYSQTTWTTQIPLQNVYAFGVVSDMIKTNDDGFIVMLKNYKVDGFIKSQQYMVKYNAEGELEWEKEYDFGVQSPYSMATNTGGPLATKIVQVNNRFFSTGTYLENDSIYCYVFESDVLGDSISLTKTFIEEERCIFPQFYVDSKVYDINYNYVSEEYSLIELDNNLQVLNEIVLGDYGLSKLLLDDELNSYLIRHSVQGVFRKFSPSGALLYEEGYDNEDLGQLNVFSENGDLTSYRKGLIQLNEDFSTKWYVASEDLLIAPNAPQLKQNAQILTATSDGGFVLGGYYGSSGISTAQFLVYIIKVDEFGQWEWGYSYSPNYIGLNYIFKLVEVDDGYVFVGTSEVTENVWLVKLNKQGLFTTSIKHSSLMPIPQLSIFPNPTSGLLNISFTKLFTGTIKIFNSQGFEMGYYDLKNETDYQSDLTFLPNGVYFIMFSNEEGFVFSKKIMKISFR